MMIDYQRGRWNKEGPTNAQDTNRYLSLHGL